MAGTTVKAFDPKALLASTSRGHTVRVFRKGGVVFEQAAAADAVFYIARGKIKITVASRQGKKAAVGILEPGDFIGVGCLAGQPRRLATATAMTKCEVTRVDKAEMIRLLGADPSFRELFTKHLLIRNSRLEEDLVDQLFNSSERRLARTLLLLAHVDKEGGLQPIEMKIDQGTLAEIVGTTRPRISRFMNKFRKLGFISYDSRHLQVYSSLSSVVAAWLAIGARQPCAVDALPCSKAARLIEACDLGFDTYRQKTTAGEGVIHELRSICSQAGR